MKFRMWFLRLLLITPVVIAISLTAARDSSQDLIPAAEFSKIIANFSEEEGYFLSDNLVSNEDGYLSILNKLRDLHVSGGAYLGVGPEQNFTYIAKIRPSIAFLIDIRRQAMIQHLMYKALFHLSKNRAEFLSRLLSRRLAGKDAPDAASPLSELVDYFDGAAPDTGYFTSNLAEIERTIHTDFKFPLSKEDRNLLVTTYRSFCADGLYVSFRFSSPRRGGFGMPTLRDLLEQVDPDGNPGNFLGSAGDFQFVRNLHEKNRIIPVVGDFAGTKALKAVAAYLRDHSYTVSVFYTSNVEMYLFQNGTFDDFVGNVKALPITASSLFIRSANSRIRWSPSAYRMRTMLQYISVFLKDQQAGLYKDYWEDLIETDFIPINP
jgi:hypothetical protein